ncbi:hypothetical protein PHMEG_00025740 [Phytophthora megakarya]|uniref:Uncharacterized protein n=1 Tax=Phytophthora megakarya TaxID=4795 RepID=A0A225VCR7_9STRA|nr:hypothetical protein PHMEG_00025740 [Phytophthora megakarya]
MEKILQGKTNNDQNLPLVLRFWGLHYSALVHSDGHPGSKQDERGVNLERSQEPWNPLAWNGDITELRDRLDGLSIPHYLKQEIQQVLHAAEPDRYEELLSFLVHTVTGLSLPEQETLLKTDLLRADEEDVQLWCCELTKFSMDPFPHLGQDDW